MKQDFDKFCLHIKKYTPKTIPFKRLMEYLEQLQKLFDGEEIYLNKIAKGSAAPEFWVRTDNSYKIEQKIASLSEIENPTSLKLIKLLRDDDTTAYFTKNNRRIFDIKEANDNIVKYDIKDAYEICGYVIKVGGRDETIPFSIRDLYDDTIIYNCNTNKNVAKEIAKYLFETPIKVSGIANWCKIGNSNWELKHFNVKTYEVLNLDSIENDLENIFKIDEDWYKENTVEEFMHKIRGDDE